MRTRLTDAAIEALIEEGYARTTAVEVCRRAGVSRGAFHHHFASLSELFAEALERLYERMLAVRAPHEGDDGEAPTALEVLVRRISAYTRRAEFKAIIEIWLAARNDAELRVEVAPAIQRLSSLFSPEHLPKLARHLGKSPRAAAFYRLVLEATIGMALGRAVSPSNRPLAHEKAVIELLASIAKTL